MKHILIIEDDTSIAELERDYLEANGITSEIVSNGELGLQKALHQDYDLILLDVMLPGTGRFFNLPYSEGTKKYSYFVGFSPSGRCR